MENNALLVIDKSPEYAQEINSLLRNSGISVRVLFADNQPDIQDALEKESPFLLILGDPDPQSANLGRVLKTTAENDLKVVFPVSPAEPEHVLEILSAGRAVVVNSEDPDQLIELVRDEMGFAHERNESGSLSRQMTELQDRYNLLLDSSREAIAYIHEGFHVYANRAYQELLRVEDAEELSGMSLLEFMTSDDSDMKKLLRDIGLGDFPEDGMHVQITRPSGTEFTAELFFSPAKFDGEPCTQMMVRERTAESELAEELDRLRRMDHLTRMINRQTFKEQLDSLISDGHSLQTSTAVLYLEPDDVQNLSHQLGVTGSDNFISDLADVIRGCIDQDDVPARFGDHAFTILVRREVKGDLEQPGNCIVSSYHDHIIDIGDSTMSGSCSIGLASIGPMTRNAEEIIAQAQQAFREAAETGNRLCRYRPKLHAIDTAEENRQWAERIRYALNNHDFYTVQKSIANLEGESEGLFENATLMREEDSESKPEEYIPAAEEFDLASGIDRLVIPGLLSAISGTGDQHIIPISSNSIMDFSFPGWFSRQLEESDVQGSQIVLQFSAGSALNSLKPTRRLIDELKTRGCRFSISEFDDERRKRQLLEHLDISMVKMRRGLTRDLNGNAENQELIRKVVRAAEEQDVLVIADDVSDASDLAVLWQCGIKLVTGDFLKESPQVVGQ